MALDSCVTGKPQKGVSDGYWVMLAPLPKGEHTIHILASSDVLVGGLLDVTYHITVAKPPHGDRDQDDDRDRDDDRDGRR